jgi:O-antigen/teichoic acid export membrane protein
MKQTSLTPVKNAFANVARGCSGAIVTLLLPPLLTKILSHDSYGTWLLILQLSTYVGLLDFGVQTAIGRFVAHSNELEDVNLRDSIISTSLLILTCSGAVAFFGILALTWQLPNLFKEMPLELQPDARSALMLVGGSLALGLPFSAFGGVFVGLQRYDIPAWIIGTSKLIGAAFVLLVAYSSHSIVWMSFALALSNICCSIWQFLAFKQLSININISTKMVSKSSAIEITSYCYSISISTIAMMLVSGLDILIVGIFDYGSVVYYTLATSITNLAVNLHSSIFTVMLPVATIVNARDELDRLGEIFISTVKCSTILLIAMTIFVIEGGDFFLKLWVGENYALHTISILMTLMIANSIRLIGWPYVITVLAVAQQNLIIISPLIEGSVNFIISVFLVKQFGAIGAAIGTAIGGFVGVVYHFSYNLPRTNRIKVKPYNLAVESVFKPIAAITPYFLCKILIVLRPELNNFELLLLTISFVLSLQILWKYILDSDEKEHVLLYLRKKNKVF